MRAEDYIAMVLEQKKSVIRLSLVHIGEFVFDYRGDLIGFYVGSGQLMMYTDLLKSNCQVLVKQDHTEEEPDPKSAE